MDIQAAKQETQELQSKIEKLQSDHASGVLIDDGLLSEQYRGMTIYLQALQTRIAKAEQAETEKQTEEAKQAETVEDTEDVK